MVLLIPQRAKPFNPSRPARLAGFQYKTKTTMTLTDRYMICLIASIAMMFSSCTKETSKADMKQTAIYLTVDVPETKATIFDSPSSLKNPGIGGGDFAVYAILSGNTSAAGNAFMSDVRVNYFPDAGDWRFMDEKGQYVNFYWPLGDERLDFFGHFPLNPEDAGVSDIALYATGPSFKFSLPLHSYDASADRNADRVSSKTPNQEGLREFVYSYVPDQSKETQNADSDNPGIKMNFSHPFAAVSFRLGQSYRMTLHNITLSNIKYEGIYSWDDDWSIEYVEDNTGQPKIDDLWIEIEKDIPTSINFNSPIGGPYLVAPQGLDDASELIVRYTRLDGQRDEKSVRLNMLGATTLEAGRHYVYTLGMGNNEEEILFQVKVEKWTVMDYKNEVDVE